MAVSKRHTLGGMQVYKRLLQYVRPHWKVFIPAVIAMLISAATEGGFSAIMKPMLDEGFINRDPDAIQLIPLWILLLFLLRGAMRFISTYCMGWIGRRVIADIRSDMFDRLLVLPASFYDEVSSGTLLSRLMYNVENVARATTSCITIIIRDTFTIIVLISWMIYLNATLALVFILIAPIIALSVRLVSARMRMLSRRVQDAMGLVSHSIEEVIDGHREVKLFGGHKGESERFRGVVERNRHQQMKLIVVDALFTPVVQLISAAALAGVVYLATSGTLVGEISAGTFVSFIVAMVMLLSPVKRMTTVNSDLQKGIAAGESVFELLDTASELDSGTKVLTGSEGAVTYEHVTHQYAGGSVPVLDDINLDIRPGETVAFVGRSGSGKTTLISLLARFYNPDEGVISLDGIPISELTLTSLREQIAFVGQSVNLFNTTVRENICYGLSGVSEDRLLSAVRSAHALEFIEKLPGGFDSFIGENGVLLSGGQRQRLAIARAIIKDAPILILDEATASLDTESERFIQGALDELMQQRTTLVVAHRLSTIENADRIVVLDHGRIVETGTHAELLADSQIYAGLYRMQFKE